MDFLTRILTTKAEEIANMPEEPLLDTKNRPSLYQTIQQSPEHMHLIGEVKRASPSKGVINQTVDCVAQAIAYQQAGVSGISVLTDEQYFNGSIEDLRKVSQVVDTPLLCKDFIISKKQLLRAKNAGASIVLLIVAALSDHQLANLHSDAYALGLEVLVEVHDQQELQRALAICAKIIGVNNRDLRTFNVSIDVSVAMAPKQADTIFISESGFRTDRDVAQVARDYQGILVGETLMRSRDIAATVKELQVPRS